MRRIGILLIVLLAISAAAAHGHGRLIGGQGSFGWYQAISTTPGVPYHISALWEGTGNQNWCEVLFFTDDGRALYDQFDAPANSSIISKVDGWGMNGGMPFAGPIDNFYFPSGLHTSLITATGTTMYVVLKTGSVGTGTDVTFHDVAVSGTPEGDDNLIINGDFQDGENGWTRWESPWGGDPRIWTTVPEPGSVLALLCGLAGALGLRRRRG